jgi:hypothetical protein
MQGRNPKPNTAHQSNVKAQAMKGLSTILGAVMAMPPAGGGANTATGHARSAAALAYLVLSGRRIPLQVKP